MLHMHTHSCSNYAHLDSASSFCSDLSTHSHQLGSQRRCGQVDAVCLWGAARSLGCTQVHRPVLVVLLHLRTC